MNPKDLLLVSACQRNSLIMVPKPRAALKGAPLWKQWLPSTNQPPCRLSQLFLCLLLCLSKLISFPKNSYQQLDNIKADRRKHNGVREMKKNGSTEETRTRCTREHAAQPMVPVLALAHSYLRYLSLCSHVESHSTHLSPPYLSNRTVQAWSVSSERARARLGHGRIKGISSPNKSANLTVQKCEQQPKRNDSESRFTQCLCFMFL